jgi:bifunctional pyridoxal-dependent enzyme with beta-cystathionase and maltose regulon repressor activities
MENNYQKDISKESKDFNKTNSLILAKIEQIFLDNGKTADEFNITLDKLGEAISVKTAEILLMSNPPNVKLNPDGIEDYLGKNFTQEELIKAKEIASRGIITEWLAIITRINN